MTLTPTVRLVEDGNHDDREPAFSSSSTEGEQGVRMKLQVSSVFQNSHPSYLSENRTGGEGGLVPPGSSVELSHIASEEEDDDDDDDDFDSTLSPSLSSPVQVQQTTGLVLIPDCKQTTESRFPPESPAAVTLSSAKRFRHRLQSQRDSEENHVTETATPLNNAFQCQIAVSMSLSPVDSAPLVPSGEQSTLSTPPSDYLTPSVTFVDVCPELQASTAAATITAIGRDLSHPTSSSSSSSLPVATEYLNNIINNNNNSGVR